MAAFALLMVVISPLLTLAANQIKGLDDAILFLMHWPGADTSLLVSADTSLLESPDYEKLVMMSSNNEQYQCLVPINYGNKDESSETYTGPSAFTLLLPLFRKQLCVLRLDSYWTYELCHGLHLKQYREEREGKTARLHEYTLGMFSLESFPELMEKHDAENLRSNIPTTKIEGLNMPYFMVNYTSGTICDLTGRPRLSHVLFVCYEEGHHEIYSIKETYTCEYEIIVLSPYLCQHPSYRPQDLPQTSLHCVPMNDSPKRPRNLLRIEAESLKLRSDGAVLAGDTSSGSVKLEVVEGADTPSGTSTTSEPRPKLSLFPPQPAIDRKLVEDFLSGEYCLHGWTSMYTKYHILKMYHYESAYFAKRMFMVFHTKEATRASPKLSLFPPQPAIDRKLVEDFLSGEYCLHGGSGWWKYEFCYGRKVEQYHEDREGYKIIILLGAFNLEEHRKWVEKTPGEGQQGTGLQLDEKLITSYLKVYEISKVVRMKVNEK
nr:endoplasmic reticulum lectin 1-like [Cherax quadricarinatus]